MNEGWGEDRVSCPMTSKRANVAALLVPTPGVRKQLMQVKEGEICPPLAPGLQVDRAGVPDVANSCLNPTACVFSYQQGNCPVGTPL